MSSVTAFQFEPVLSGMIRVGYGTESRIMNMLMSDAVWLHEAYLSEYPTDNLTDANVLIQEPYNHTGVSDAGTPTGAYLPAAMTIQRGFIKNQSVATTLKGNATGPTLGFLQVRFSEPNDLWGYVGTDQITTTDSPLIPFWPDIYYPKIRMRVCAKDVYLRLALYSTYEYLKSDFTNLVDLEDYRICVSDTLSTIGGYATGELVIDLDDGENQIAGAAGQTLREWRSSYKATEPVWIALEAWSNGSTVGNVVDNYSSSLISYPGLAYSSF